MKRLLLVCSLIITIFGSVMAKIVKYTNPANSAQKLIRRGNVYILQDGKTYSINGTRVE